jgi:hypothetical protein
MDLAFVPRYYRWRLQQLLDRRLTLVSPHPDPKHSIYFPYPGPNCLLVGQTADPSPPFSCRILLPIYQCSDPGQTIHFPAEMGRIQVARRRHDQGGHESPDCDHNADLAHVLQTDRGQGVQKVHYLVHRKAHYLGHQKAHDLGFQKGLLDDHLFLYHDGSGSQEQLDDSDFARPLVRNVVGLRFLAGGSKISLYSQV